jgi:ribosomal protein S18 acetylase RimI-like enzyme
MQFVTISRSHLDGIVALCRQEGWPSFSEPDRAWRALTAPGVTTIVAVENDEVIGFAYVQSDGEIQAHLSDILVNPQRRRRGIGRRLIEEAFARCGAERIDLVSTEGSAKFYESFEHRRFPGYRIYPKGQK